MKKIDPVVIKETLYIAQIGVLLSALMQAVFLIIGYWSLPVLLGNVYGMIMAVGNFFLMGVSVQQALDKEPDDAKKHLKVSQSLRTLLLFVLAVVAYLLPFIDVIAAVLPYLFPRVAIALRPLFKKD